MAVSLSILQMRKLALELFRASTKTTRLETERPAWGPGPADALPLGRKPFPDEHNALVTAVLLVVPP